MSALELVFTGTQKPKDYTLLELGAIHRLRRGMEHLVNGRLGFFPAVVVEATFTTLNNMQVLIQREAHARYLETSTASASSAVKGSSS